MSRMQNPATEPGQDAIEEDDGDDDEWHHGRASHVTPPFFTLSTNRSPTTIKTNTCSTSSLL